MKRATMFLVVLSILLLALATACDRPPDPPPPLDQVQQAVRPTSTPARSEVSAAIPKGYDPKSLSYPCRMVVLNNNIHLLAKPQAGAALKTSLTGEVVALRVGSVIDAQGMAGDWIRVPHHLIDHGWIHKDNLYPARK